MPKTEDVALGHVRLRNGGSELRCRGSSVTSNGLGLAGNLENVSDPRCAKFNEGSGASIRDMPEVGEHVFKRANNFGNELKPVCKKSSAGSVDPDQVTLRVGGTVPMCV